MRGEKAFRVDNITCPGCAEDIERLLKEEEGVFSVSVNYRDATIYVEYNPEVIDEDRLGMIIKRLGLRARAI